MQHNTNAILWAIPYWTKATMTGAKSESRPTETGRTEIYKFTADGEIPIGRIGEDRVIYQLRQGAVGRVDAHGRVFARTRHDERELGRFTQDGRVHSHGLFEGGMLGWVDPDGVVVRAGLILGEEEVGRVAGPAAAAAAAALLLLFLPNEAEADKRASHDA
jgi:hypothetical protein